MTTPMIGIPAQGSAKLINQIETAIYAAIGPDFFNDPESTAQKAIAAIKEPLTSIVDNWETVKYIDLEKEMQAIRGLPHVDEVTLDIHRSGDTGTMTVDLSGVLMSPVPNPDSISISLSPLALKFTFCTGPSTTARSIHWYLDGDLCFPGWDRRRLFHPHWIQRENPCLGDFQSAVVQLGAEHDFASLTAVLTAYLQQYDPRDCAGKFATNWADTSLGQSDDAYCQYDRDEDRHDEDCDCEECCDSEEDRRYTRANPPWLDTAENHNVVISQHAGPTYFTTQSDTYAEVIARNGNHERLVMVKYTADATYDAMYIKDCFHAGFTPDPYRTSSVVTRQPNLVADYLQSLPRADCTSLCLLAGINARALVDSPSMAPTFILHHLGDVADARGESLLTIFEGFIQTYNCSHPENSRMPDTGYFLQQQLDLAAIIPTYARSIMNHE